MKILWTRLAVANLKEICEYKKQFNTVKNVRRFRKSIFDRTKTLSDFPRLGIKTESKRFPDFEFRKIIEGKIAIIYMVAENEIQILRVLDTRQSDETQDF